MKNYKLDVVRYNNEDVIATSGEVVKCNVTPAEGDIFINIYKINTSTGYFEYDIYHYNGTEFVHDGYSEDDMRIDENEELGLTLGFYHLIESVPKPCTNVDNHKFRY